MLYNMRIGAQGYHQMKEIDSESLIFPILLSFLYNCMGNR